MNLSTHFTLEELTHSQWAERAGINNEPGPNELANLRRLADVLELVRYTLGAPVIVSSGYRDPIVNRAIGGSSSSHHVLGLAADFICPGFGTPAAVCRKLMSQENIKFDQLINEYNRWTHIGIPINGIAPRLQALSKFRGTRYLSGILDKP